MKMNRVFFVLMFLSAVALPAGASADDTTSYRVPATNKTSTMQKEMQEAGEAGFRFAAVMGGETSFGGKEVVVLMQKAPGMTRREYRLLAANKTSTLQKELQEVGDQGFQALGMTLGETANGGGELVVITRRKVQ